MATSPVTVLAVDPGSEKWGLAVVERSGVCLHREVVPAVDAAARVKEFLDRYPIGEILLGDRTGSRRALEALQQFAVPVHSVPEHRTTLIARSLYWRDHPPVGWRRLLPRGLLLPSVLLDAYAAEALALRHFGLLEE